MKQPGDVRGLQLTLRVYVLIFAAAPLVKLFTQKKRGAAAHAQLMELLNDELGLLAARNGHASPT